MTELFTGLTGLSVAGVITYLVRRDHIQVRHGVGWILVAGVFVVLGFAPSLLDKIALWLGVAYPPTVALVVGGSALILKAVISDVELSRSETRLMRLVQRIAMLEADIRRLEQRVEQEDQNQRDTDR